MPITYDMEKDAFFLRGVQKGEARGEVRGEEKILKHVVGVCQERGFSMEETANFLKLPVGTVEKYWGKD